VKRLYLIQDALFQKTVKNMTVIWKVVLWITWAAIGHFNWSVTSCVITASPSLINSALRLLYVIDYWTHFSVGLRGLAEVQSWQRGEWGSRVCGSQWKSRADKIQEHQGKMEYTMREKSVALCLRSARPLDQRQASCLLLGNNFKVFSAHS